MADFDAMQVMFTEEEFDLRNKDLHEYHLNQQQEHPSLHEHYSKEYGIVKKKAFFWMRHILM